MASAVPCQGRPTEVSCRADATRPNTCTCHPLNYDRAVALCPLEGRSSSSGRDYISICRPRHYPPLLPLIVTLTQTYLVVTPRATFKTRYGWSREEADAAGGCWPRAGAGPSRQLPVPTATLHAPHWGPQSWGGWVTCPPGLRAGCTGTPVCPFSLLS